jgi:hypothetical protein
VYESFRDSTKAIKGILYRYTSVYENGEPNQYTTVTTLKGHTIPEQQTVFVVSAKLQRVEIT